MKISKLILSIVIIFLSFLSVFSFIMYFKTIKQEEMNKEAEKISNFIASNGQSALETDSNNNNNTENIINNDSITYSYDGANSININIVSLYDGEYVSVIAYDIYYETNDDRYEINLIDYPKKENYFYFINEDKVDDNNNNKILRYYIADGYHSNDNSGIASGTYTFESIGSAKIKDIKPVYVKTNLSLIYDQRGDSSFNGIDSTLIS